MTATQSSIGTFSDPIDQEVCCTPEKVLDGVYLIPRIMEEFQYISAFSTETKFLLIDTKGIGNVARVSLFFGFAISFYSLATYIIVTRIINL